MLLASMELPLFRQLNYPEELTLSDLIKYLIKIDFLKFAPWYLELPTNLALCKKMLTQLQKAMTELDLVFSEGLPLSIYYPFYVITSQSVPAGPYFIIHHKHELPDHYLSKSKKITSRETALLSKIMLQRQKIETAKELPLGSEIKSLVENQRNIAELIWQVQQMQEIMGHWKKSEE